MIKQIYFWKKIKRNVKEIGRGEEEDKRVMIECNGKDMLKLRLQKRNSAMKIISTEANFLQHLITLIQERANELQPISKTENDFEGGRSLAYHEVMDFVLECSRVFNLPLEDLGIFGLDADRLL